MGEEEGGNEGVKGEASIISKKTFKEIKNEGWIRICLAVSTSQKMGGDK